MSAPCRLVPVPTGGSMLARLLVAAVCLPVAGCHLFYPERGTPILNTFRTVLYEPAAFPLHKNDYLSRVRYKLLAHQAWNEVIAANPEMVCSADYEFGFREGFADYVYAGGTGDPPPLPPRRYWRLGYESPAGRQAIQDWFAGFRHGSDVARQGGYRQDVTVPSSMQVTSAGLCQDQTMMAPSVESFPPVGEPVLELPDPTGVPQPLPPPEQSPQQQESVDLSRSRQRQAEDTAPSGLAATQQEIKDAVYAVDIGDEVTSSDDADSQPSLRLPASVKLAPSAGGRGAPRSAISTATPGREQDRLPTGVSPERTARPKPARRARAKASPLASSEPLTQPPSVSGNDGDNELRSLKDVAPIFDWDDGWRGWR